MGSPAVLIVANDVVPGMGLPVAAPGLRAHGLGEGLRRHGLKVVTIVDRKPLRALVPGGMPPVLPPATMVLEGPEIGDFAAERAPAVLVITNSNQIDRLRPAAGLSLVVDLFAPKMLELACSREGPKRDRALAALRERKLRAIASADAFIVNGAKKVPYFLGWLAAAGRDPIATPLEVVPMAVPGHFPPPQPESAGVCLLVAGYLQGWSAPGPWLDRLAARLDPPRVTLDLLLPQHWGRRRPMGAAEARLEALAGRPGVTRHEAMPYEDFLGLIGRATVAVDLFAHTLEREYAVVTRTVVALACGVPVVHPPFTEVSPLVAAYDAGWLVDPDDPAAVDAAFAEVTGRPDIVAAKAEGARRLWRETFDPQVAVAPLARLVRALAGTGA
jgi:glycosyltransferase involved in cell wall biosynthesis